MSDYSAYSDQELTALLKKGEDRAFEQIYKKYSTRIYGNILKLVHDEAVADDLLQDLFLQIWARRAHIDTKKSFQSYLFTCSKHLVYNFLRRSSLEKQVSSYLSYNNTELYSHIQEELDHKETEVFYKDAIAKLPPQRQKIYTLCKIEGHSYEEVAQLLGITTSTIHDHIVKANRAIKEQMLSNHSILIIGLLACLID